MIRTQGLSKHFDGHVAVEELSVDIQLGEVFGFLGPNGAGKTTTVRILCGLIGRTSGEAWVAGYRVGHQDREIRKRVGILTETPGLYDRLSAEYNLGFFGRLYEVENLAEQAERYLRLLGLWDRRAEAVGTFSKGMRQKLAIARALLHEPQVLFLDEPTSGLDPEAARLVREFVADLRGEGRTIFLCTHNLDEADRLCDRIAVFNQHLLALDSPAALRRQLYGRTVVFHLRQPALPFVPALESFGFVRSVQAMEDKLVVGLDDPDQHNPKLVRELVEGGADIRFVGELRRTLEDVYLRLVKAPGPEVS